MITVRLRQWSQWPPVENEIPEERTREFADRRAIRDYAAGLMLAPGEEFEMLSERPYRARIYRPQGDSGTGPTIFLIEEIKP